MKSKKKFLAKKLVMLTSLLGICILPISLGVVTSCSSFEPDINPNIPSNKPNNKPEHQVPKIDYSSSQTVQEAYFKSLKWVDKNYNKMFQADLKNDFFGPFKDYYPLNFGFWKDNSYIGLIQRLENKFMEWYNNDNAAFIATGWYNIMNFMGEIIWTFYIGLNYTAISFYDYCKISTVQDQKEIFNYLSVPLAETPYINLLNNQVSTNLSSKYFMEFWPNAMNSFIQDWQLNNVNWNSISYYLDSIEYCLNTIKSLFELKIPKSFQETFPNAGTDVKTFYQFYLSPTLTEQQIKENEKRITNEMTNGYQLVKTTRINLLDSLKLPGA